MAYTVSRPKRRPLPTDPEFYLKYGQTGRPGEKYVPPGTYWDWEDPETETREYRTGFPNQPRPGVPGGGPQVASTANTIGSLLSLGGPAISAAIAGKGAAAGGTGLGQIPDGVGYYIDQAGNFIKDASGNITSGLESISEIPGKITGGIGDAYSTAKEFFSPTPAALPPNTMQLVGPGYPGVTQAGEVASQIDLSNYTLPGFETIPTDNLAGGLAGNMPSNIPGQRPVGFTGGGAVSLDPVEQNILHGASDSSPQAGMAGTALSTGTLTAGFSFVGGYLQKQPSNRKEWSNLLSDSAGAGIGAGIGTAIGTYFGVPQIGAMIGSTVLGKWAGNAIDAVGDAIGKGLEWIGDLF